LIVDGHTHIIPTLGQDKTSEELIKFDWSDLEQWLLSEPESKCVVIPKIEQFSNSVALNVEFLERLRTFRQRNRVFPFLWIHPQQLLEEHFKRFIFSGFKLHPSISQMTVVQSENVLDLCEKYEKPLLIHCGRGEKSRIDYILSMNEHYPSVKFVCAHMGGLATDLIVRAFEQLSRCRSFNNLYLDTSGCFHPKLIEKAVQLMGSNRVIFATDRPFHSYEMSVYAVSCCNLDIETKEKILGYNILEVLS
jgi:predicted TIM-barrel fold metal-dependent hydrolase